jgi:hypothetical protein
LVSTTAARLVILEADAAALQPVALEALEPHRPAAGLTVLAELVQPGTEQRVVVDVAHERREPHQLLERVDVAQRGQEDHVRCDGADALREPAALVGRERVAVQRRELDHLHVGEPRRLVLTAQHRHAVPALDQLRDQHRGVALGASDEAPGVDREEDVHRAAGDQLPIVIRNSPFTLVRRIFWISISMASTGSSSFSTLRSIQTR